MRLFGARALLLLTGCSHPALPAPGPTQAEQDHATRQTEAAVNGVTTACPADKPCIDSYGLVWTKCAWERVGHDDQMRTDLDKAAEQTDPKRSWTIDCETPVPGYISI